ncbi:hypothetical protein BH24ACI4_BH24ACI4_25760 [soil metagenome]
MEVDVSRRFSAILLVLVLGFAAGPASVCAGWMATPEARMACCSEGAGCPMHPSDSDHSIALTQAQADRCCASSAERDAAPSTSGFTLSIGPGPAPVPFSFTEISRDRHTWRALVPIRGTHVPKHLLLSVFLV